MPSWTLFRGSKVSPRKDHEIRRMKHTRVLLLLTVLGLLLGGLGLLPGTSSGNFSPVQAGEAKKREPSQAAGAQERKGKKERHPHIHAAIRECAEARKELETADHDFGGHRKEAIKAVDDAIKQLELALKFDKK
jgi:hypothetical protein